MNLDDRNFAEETIKKLLVGCQFDGIKFGINEQNTFLYFTHFNRNEDVRFWINIETEWCLLNNINSEISIKYTEEEQLKQLTSIRREKVTGIKLGDESPHLYIIFESNKVLYINGFDENYECWQLGDGEDYLSDKYLVVALAENGICTWVD